MRGEKMITLKKAFEIASKNSNGVTLSPQAYDLGESWAFDYGGTDEINGFFPVIIHKTTGAVIPFNFPADYIRISKAPRVKK